MLPDQIEVIVEVVTGPHLDQAHVVRVGRRIGPAVVYRQGFVISTVDDGDRRWRRNGTTIATSVDLQVVAERDLLPESRVEDGRCARFLLLLEVLW